MSWKKVTYTKNSSLEEIDKIENSYIQVPGHNIDWYSSEAIGCSCGKTVPKATEGGHQRAWNRHMDQVDELAPHNRKVKASSDDVRDPWFENGKCISCGCEEGEEHADECEINEVNPPG